MSSPAPILVKDQKLTPPQPKFVLEATSDGDSERHPSSLHSRTTSGAVSYVESPPMTPRSTTFGNHPNPFSPPASVASFNSGPDTTPGHTHHNSVQYPFPDSTRSGVTSRTTSVADLTRLSSSYYGSRPNTADFGLAGSTRPSSARLREAFTSPPTRPMTILSVAPVSKVERERPKSTMLAAKGPLHKPWLESRDPYSRIAYLLTYGVMLIGVGLGALRCYLGWYDVPLLQGPMCLVMDENFESDEGIFGENGKFLREVDMSGFG
jgi:hypothetical protein